MIDNYDDTSKKIATNFLQLGKRIVSHKKEAMIIWFSDIIFFLCFAASHYFVIQMIVPIRTINELIAKNADAISPLILSKTPSMFPMATFQSSFMLIIKNTLFFLLAIFLSWVLFQGFSWWKTHKLLGHKVKFLSYLKRFLVISVVWFASMLFFFLMSIRLSMYLAIVSFQGFKSWASTALILLIALFFCYVALVAYATCAKGGLKKMSMHLWKEMKLRVVMILLGGVGVVLAGLIVVLLNNVSALLPFFGMVFVFIPALMGLRFLATQ